MKKIVLCGVSLAVLLVITLAFVSASPKHSIARQLDLTLPKAETVAYTDTHSMIRGEGLTVGSLHFDPDNAAELRRQIEESNAWSPLPLTQNIGLLMNGGELNGITYTDRFAEQYGILDISNGSYFFWDRLNNTNQDVKLLTRSAFGFTLALYDYDTDFLYFFRYDT